MQALSGRGIKEMRAIGLETDRYFRVRPGDLYRGGWKRSEELPAAFRLKKQDYPFIQRRDGNDRRRQAGFVTAYRDRLRPHSEDDIASGTGSAILDWYSRAAHINRIAA